MSEMKLNERTGSRFNRRESESRLRRPQRSGGPLALLVAMALCIPQLASVVLAHDISELRVPLEKLVYPPTTLTLLDVRGEQVSWPFEINFFRTDLLAYLRSADYLEVKTESEVADIIARNRATIPDTYEPDIMTRIGRLTHSDYVAYLRMIAITRDRHDGFEIPVLFKRNKVTYTAELDLAVVKIETGTLHYSRKVLGKASLGRGVKVYPVVEDPSTHLDIRRKEELGRTTMQDLARRTFEALMEGIHKDMDTKYICYWDDEVHIIADKSGLCPICGSRLVRIQR
ncbi:MAG: hypothetical protein FVQ81_12995 [Candidatus Glassbacteria bacterium]|nr:hypothetical protein [Candidatus Glassbacteria bacterium]